MKKDNILLLIVFILWCIMLGSIIYFWVNPKEVSQESSTVVSGWVEESVEYDVAQYENIYEVVNIANCDIVDSDWLESLWYKYVDVFSWEVRNPKAEPGNHKEYTNEFYVQPWIEDAYLCVVANVISSLQNENGYYYLWILFNNAPYEWLVNVAINSKKTPYDYTSDWANPNLTGRMYGLELKEHDKNYWLNLNWFIVWIWGWWYAVISPIDRLNLWNQKTLRIWWYVTAWENWIIKKFRIFYKWWIIDRLE